MPDTPDTLARLRADYTALDATPPASLSDGQRRSLRYHHTDLALEAGIDVVDRPVRIVLWMTRIRDVEQRAASDALPRQNRRRHAEDPDGQKLAGWITRQRSDASRAHHCEYQTRRLLLLPDFDLSPIETAWRDQYDRYASFLTENHRAPAYRTPIEWPPARWAAAQRTQYRAGTLPADRIAQLERLSIWSWG